MTSRLPLAWLTVLGGFIVFWLFAGALRAGRV
jgi:hypothetical protein